MNVTPAQNDQRKVLNSLPSKLPVEILTKSVPSTINSSKSTNSNIPNISQKVVRLLFFNY